MSNQDGFQRKVIQYTKVGSTAQERLAPGGEGEPALPGGRRGLRRTLFAGRRHARCDFLEHLDTHGNDDDGQSMMVPE